MAVRKTRKQEKKWLVPVLVLSGFALLFGVLIKLVLSESGAKPPKQIQVINLIKPPPDVKEKLPEPEVPKEVPKQTIETPTEAPAPADNSPADDSPPAGDNLAVDGDGGAGDNAFGLGAKKGGRAITLGGGGGGGGGGMNRLSLLSKYGGYSRLMQADIEKRVKKVLEQEGGRPKGKQQTVIKLTLAPDGTILKFAIVGSSGVERLDAAFRTALNGLRLSEPPHEGMPGTMTLRITTSA
jgi:periplasmic protein TonB